MYGRIVAALATALVLTGVLASDALAQRWRERERESGWLLLGEKDVGFGVDRDVIRVGQGEDWYRDRRFRTLHFIAEGNDVHMMSIRLVYFNGFAEDFRIDQLIRQGDDLPIDLRGERSYIRAIEMTYRSRPNFRGEALIRVLRRRSQPWVLVAGRRSGWMCHRPSPLRFVQIAADCERGLREAAHGNHAPSESRRQGLRVAVFMRSDLPTLGESHRGTAWVADVGRGPASGQAARRATRMGRSGETCI